MNKDAYRKKYRLLRSQLSENQIKKYSLAIANHLEDLPIWEATYYHLFLTISKQKEVDTQPIISLLKKRDKKIVIPKSEKNGDLTHFLWTDNMVLKTNQWHILEPQKGQIISENTMEVVFVPLLAYDQKGNRIGYGKGYYDLFLSKCSAEAVKIGLSFFDPLRELIPAEPHDIPLDYVVTPYQSFYFPPFFWCS